MTQKETLLAHLNDLLPEMDQSLSKGGIPVSERPMKAARLYVDHFVLQIEGDTKENYLLKPWFALIFRPIQDWYERRYGAAQVHPEHFSAGTVKHHGAFFLMRIPLTVAKPQEDGTCWLTFAKDMLPGEDPASWIVNGPSLVQMRPKQLEAIRKEAASTATRIRGIANDLLTANLPLGSVRTMANSVLHHLQKAATDMCAQGPEAASLSVWDLHMACEKVMKVYLTQEGIPLKKTHDLRDLNADAPKKHDWSAVKTALGCFPSERRVMQWRYQEIDAPTLDELWRFYDVALKVCSTYAARMSRKYILDNFAVQLRRPTWLGND